MAGVTPLWVETFPVIGLVARRDAERRVGVDPVRGRLTGTAGPEDDGVTRDRDPAETAGRQGQDRQKAAGLGGADLDNRKERQADEQHAARFSGGAVRGRTDLLPGHGAVAVERVQGRLLEWRVGQIARLARCAEVS